MLLKDRRFFGSKFGWILVKGCAQTAVKFNSEIWTVPPRKPVVQEDVGKNRIDLEIHFSLQITPRLQDTPHDTTRFRVPIPSMYGIFTYIYHENQPNVGKYTIHGSSNPMQFIYCSQNRSAKFQAHHSYAWRVYPSCLEDTQGLVQLYAGIPVPVNQGSGCISCNSMHTYLQCINIQ